MKLSLKRLGEVVNRNDYEAGSLLEDASTFEPSSLKKNDHRKGPAGNAGGRKYFPNSNENDQPDVIAQKYITSAHNYIQDEFSEELDAAEFQSKIDKFKNMGTRYKHIFEANDKDGAEIYKVVDSKIIDLISGEMLTKEAWIEMIGEKLRKLEKCLAEEIRTLIGSQDVAKTWADLTESFTREWGADALTVAGLTWALKGAAQTAIWLYKKFMGTEEVEAGPVAENFIEVNGIEDVYNALGVEE